jgi:Fur family ferric uptake transcriptional regulator
LKNGSKKHIVLEKKKFLKYLDQADLKLTEGRKIIFDEVMHTHGHFAPEELAKKCRDNKQKVSRATVYRTLRELREAGVIRETAFGEKHRHFEHVYDEKLHHHARCIRCYHIIEIPCLKEEEPYAALLKKQQFHILGHELHFYGMCKNCSG